jgi:hypothetical protein
MKRRALNIAVVISLLSLVAGMVFTFRSLYDTELRKRKLVYHKHPVIVVKVDNRGCQAEIEMRTRAVVERR